MKDWMWIFYVLYGLSGATILIGIFKSFIQEGKYRRNIEKREIIALDLLTVIIPFRNERNRIEGLLNSINDSIKYPKQFIFIDDHSTDGTSDFIKSTLLIENYKIISSNGEGKKRALAQGIQEASTEMILTFDADITFKRYYFSQFDTLSKVDMLILPVIMKGSSWKKIFEMDVDLSGAMNCCTAGFGHPILASGANLLFSKEKYLQFGNIENHLHIASGDDVFLLNSFRKNNCSIQLISNPESVVITDVPNDINEYFQQRLRWLSKTTSLRDSVTTSVALIQFSWMIIFWVLVILAIIQGQFQIIFPLFFVKAITDLSSTIMYFGIIGKAKRYLLFFMYQFWMPVISISLIIGMLFIRPTWKGRKVNSN